MWKCIHPNILAVSLLVWCAVAVHAQEVSGVVQDVQGNPVAAAHCVLGESLTLTDGMGKFVFSDVGNAVEARLVVSHLGFQDEERLLSIPSHGVVVVLRAEAQQLNAAVVQSTLVQGREATLADIRPLDVKALDAVPAASRIQALRSVAGVHLMSAGPGMLRPVLRGLSGLRVATLFLNSRVESQAWGEGHGIFFPEQGVSRMDVIRGPEVLRFGPDAYGGVLNVVPVGPLENEGRLTQLSLTGHGNTGGFQTSLMTQKRSARSHHVLLSGVNRFGEYRLPEGGRVQGSALRQFYSQGRFGYLRDWGTWEGAYSSCYNTSGIVGVGGTEQSGDHMLTMGARFRTGEWAWHPVISYQLNHRKELDVVGPDSLTEENELAYTRLDLSLRSTRFDIQTSRSGSGGWHWDLGSQGYMKSNTNDSVYIELANQLIPDADIQGGGLFAKVSHDNGRWIPSASLRGDVHGLTWQGRPTLAEDAPDALATGGTRAYGMVSGAVGVKARLNERHTLGVHVLRGNRAPGLSELLAFGNHHDSYREERGNPDLALETSHSAEVQWVKRAESSHGWSGDLAVYASQIDNFMMLMPTAEVNPAGLPIQLHQATRARLGGADVNATWVPRWSPSWSLHTALSFVESENAEGEELPWTPPPTGRWELKKVWKAGSASRGMGAIVAEASRDAVLFHASATWEWGAHLRVNAQIINLTNESYIPTLSLLRNLGIAEPGRNVRVQLVWSL